jgi:hypothetical protein
MLGVADDDGKAHGCIGTAIALPFALLAAAIGDRASPTRGANDCFHLLTTSERTSPMPRTLASRRTRRTAASPG